MKAILGPKGEPTFQRKLKKLIKTHLFEQNEIPIFQRKNLLIPEEYFISYVLSAHFGVIQQWLEGDMKARAHFQHVGTRRRCRQHGQRECSNEGAPKNHR